MGGCAGTAEVRMVAIGCVESAGPEPRWSRTSVVRVFEEYAGGLEDLDGYSHAFLIYHLNARGWSGSLRAQPRWAPAPLGVFAT
ncbi:MAG: hypothetical protein ACP5GG_02000, partial [Conexivisphaera sp.]